MSRRVPDILNQDRPTHMTRLTFGLALACLPALAPGLAQAHGIWLAQRADETAVVYGHGAEDNAYDPAKVTSVTGIGAEGATVPVEVVPHERNATVVLPEGLVAVATTFDNGFWIKDTAGEWQNVGKQEVPGGTEAHHPLKHSTHLLGGFTGALAPTGAALDLIPQQDPTALALGDTYQVQLLLNGEPLPGVAIINDYLNEPHHVTEAVTDRNGMASLEVTSEGLNVVGVEHTEPVADSPDTDELFLFSTLSFELPHVE